jgi:RNA polymerase sigma-70 factor (ECF subfamily)
MLAGLYAERTNTEFEGDSARLVAHGGHTVLTVTSLTVSSPRPDSAAAPAPPCAVPPPAQESNAQWFNREIHAHDSSLKIYLRSKFSSIRDVEDVAQESYLRVWKAKATQTITSGKAFLFQIARNLAYDLVRRDKASPIDLRSEFDDSSVLDNGPDAAQKLLAQDLLNHVLDSLVALPPRYREVVVLHKLEGLSHREIAAKMGITEKVAQKYCSLGLARQAEFLSHRGITGFFS